MNKNAKFKKDEKIENLYDKRVVARGIIAGAVVGHLAVKVGFWTLGKVCEVYLKSQA